METPYLGQIILFAFNFNPKSYALCAGQAMSIAQNAALFAVLGTTYGGNGTVTFGLPDLRGRAPMHWGSGPGLSPRVIGEVFGVETEKVLQSQIPIHNHAMLASNAASTTGVPAGSVLAVGPTVGSGVDAVALNVYSINNENNTMGGAAMAPTGGSQALPLMQPYLVLNFSIALAGIFPSRN